ncbi:MAG: hypothetical protein LBE74_09640 [Treponema sp.]|jgi:hypothetical protein|nr:hypothetical protein [Treponema sp.]
MVNLPQKRFLHIALTACLALTAVFAENFIVTHLEHECIGESCPICSQIEIAQRLLEKLGRIGVAAFFAFYAIDYTKLLAKRSEGFFLPLTTPVSLKIKINS